MSFTKTGEEIANRIAGILRDDPDHAVYTERVASLENFVASIFKRKNVLIFVGAVGIAVRAVSPFLKSKTTDPPVLVVDELGRFVIPILSGHLGGANRWAEKIALKIGAVPVITTATDLHHVFAVDVFATENGCIVVNPEEIKTISSRLLEGKSVALTSDMKIVGSLPKNIVLTQKGEVGIHIGPKPKTKPFKNTLFLVPKCFYVGIGCRRGISFDDLHGFFLDMLETQSIPIEAVGSLSSISLKENEEAINELAERYCIPFRTYQANELREFESRFETSNFVRDTTGVGNVCEIAAWLSSNKGDVVLRKTASSGMTLAIARERREIRFDSYVNENEEDAE